jgi:small GTP-binding protein
MMARKVLLVGDAGVGKTCLAHVAVNHPFQEDYKTTIGANTMTVVKTVNNRRIKLSLWDSAGHEQFEHFTKLYAKDASAVVLVFSLTAAASFEHLPRWLELTGAESGDCKIVLVGTKLDLGDSRAVESDRANVFAGDHHIEYFESSAKTGEGVSEIFDRVAELILRYHAPEEIIAPPNEPDPPQNQGFFGWAWGKVRRGFGW